MGVTIEQMNRSPKAIEAVIGETTGEFSARAVFERAGLPAPLHWWYGGHYVAAGLDLARSRVAATDEAQGAAIARFADEAAAWAKDKAPWQPMTPDEIGELEVWLHRGHAEFRDLTRDLPWRADEVATLSLQALMVADAATHAAAMPPAVAGVIDTHYLRAIGPWRQWHQMFGLGSTIQGDNLFEHAGDVLLLQLAQDNVNHMGFGGLHQFWISPKDLAAGNWKAAVLTAETD